MEPLYEVLKVGSRKESYTDKFSVNKTATLSSTEVQKVLSVSASAFNGDSQVVGEFLEYSGSVVYYVCYIDNDGALKKYETAEGYSKKQQIELGEVCSFSSSVVVAKTDYSFEEGVMVLKAQLEFEGIVSYCQSLSAFADGDNVVADKKEIEYQKSFGRKTANYPLEEEFELSYQVKDVVAQNVDGVITSVQCGIGSIIADGEVYLRCLLLQNDVKGDIIKEERTIPFRVEIECDEAMPQMTATSSVVVGGLKTNISVDENTGKSSVVVSVNLKFTAEAFAEEKAEVLCDVFSTTDELDVRTDGGVIYYPEKSSICEARASGRVVFDELSIGTRVTATCDEKFEIVNYTCDGAQMSVEGVLSMKIYLKDGDGIVVCKNAETPVSFTTDCPLSCCENKKVKVVAKNSYARLISLSETEIGATLSVVVLGEEKREFNFVGSVKPVGKKVPCVSPISVYIPKPSEDLWSLAKRLGVCPDKLIETNKDLQFPLTGNERIVIYRQK